MKLSYVLLICGLSMTLALPQYKIERKFDFPVVDSTRNLPKIDYSGGGTLNRGKVDIDVRQKVWQSPNQRHAIDIGGGYSQKWGSPDISNKPDIRYGVGYTFKL
ncbi:diptericin-D-like [Cochliomyia hominivorax]